MAVLVDPICKHTQFTFFDRTWEPRYSTKDFLPDAHSIKYAKNKLIKVVFPEVKDTNEWAGEWYIEKKDITNKSKYNNNGRDCYVVPLSQLRKLHYEYPCIHII